MKLCLFCFLTIIIQGYLGAEDCSNMRKYEISRDSFDDGSYKVLDVNLKTFPNEPDIFQEFIRQMLVTYPDIICLREIDSEALIYDFYEALEDDGYHFYREENACVASKFSLGLPHILLEEVEGLSCRNNALITIAFKEESACTDMPFNLLEYRPCAQNMWAPSTFFDRHPLISQNENFIILCRGGVSADGGRDSKGNTHVEAHVYHGSDNGSWEAKGGGEINRDRDGNISGEVNVGIKAEW